MNNSYLRAAGGMAVPRPGNLILLVGNSYNHMRNHTIGVKSMLDDSVGSSQVQLGTYFNVFHVKIYT